MAKKKLQKALTLLMAFSMLMSLMCVTAFAEEDYVAWIGDTGYKTLEAAVKAATDGDTIKLGAGKFYTSGLSIQKDKIDSLTFEGSGADQTTFLICTPNEDKHGQNNADFSLKEFVGNVTFKNMTLQAGVQLDDSRTPTENIVNRDYMGFAHLDNTVVENCVINGKTFYWGYKTAVFENTTFNAPDGDYAIWTYCSPTMTFDGCTFNSSGKTINVYTDYSAGQFDITVNYKNCTVIGNTPEGKKDKAVMNINDSNMKDCKYFINISGENIVTGVTPDDQNKEYPKEQKDISCSRLFEFNTKYGPGNSGHTIITIDNTTVWEDGEMVSHENSDGYKDNAFTVIAGDWTPDADGNISRSISKVCKYCGYTEQGTENGYTVSYDLNGGTGADGVDYGSEIAAAGSSVTVKAAPSRSGYYDFDGWSDGTNNYKAGDTLEVAGNVTLTAQWDYDPPIRDRDDDDDDKEIKEPEVPLSSGLELNKDDHFAYIKGYADGTVRPNNYITRAQVATIFYRLMTDETREMCFSETNDFSDVAPDYWANKAISTLSNAGIITGFTDGTFRPDAYITRAQFAAIAARFSVVTEDLPNPFIDVPSGYWAEDLIAFAADVGWVNGYPDGTFRPNTYITRAAAMKLINNVLERQVDEEGLLEDATQWNDCTPDDWCYYIVMEATNSHDWERRSSRSLVEDWTALTADPVWDE